MNISKKLPETGLVQQINYLCSNYYDRRIENSDANITNESCVL
ncbi:hypothetical protein [Vibrio campbellii]|nr:hypothetical protein [Vibrio campbellii]